MSKHLLLGQTLAFTGDPFQSDWSEVARVSSRGGVLIEGARIAAVGEADKQNCASTSWHNFCKFAHGDVRVVVDIGSCCLF